MDCGEPSCFACGWMAADPDDDPVLWDVWDRASLERCHLVPHALGGTDEPANLVLLCGRCHAEAPDVGDPRYMLRWIAVREYWGRAFVRELDSAIRLAGLTDEVLEAFNQRFLPDGAAALRTTMATWSVAVAGRVSYATLAACSVEAVIRVVAPRER